MITFREFLSETPYAAFKYAKQQHSNQTRSDGTPYFEHPKQVARFLQQYKKSSNMDALVQAALTHDTIEDTDTTAEDLHKLFGGLVASLVQELTSDKEEIKSTGKAEYLAKKLETMSNYALAIKLADRLSNVQDITTAKTPAWRQKYRKETEFMLNNLERKRKLTGSQKRLVKAIREKLKELDG